MKMSIDPGVTGTGIAVWRGRYWRKQPVNPAWCENLYPKGKDGEFVAKTNSILRKLEDLIITYRVDEVWCEMPEFFDDAGGHMAAKKGDLAKLTFFVGAVAGLCYKYGIQFHPVKPSTWKGQTSKDMVIRKIRTILPNIHETGCKSHSYDAVGIGLHAQGLYQR